MNDRKCPSGRVGRIQLYCNPVTSEITGEYRTLHEAIATSTAAAGAVLICDGVILATAAAARGWLFEQAGIERLHNEFKAIDERSPITSLN
jgi:hypothetical protein